MRATQAIEDANSQTPTAKKSFKYSLKLGTHVARCRRCQHHNIHAAHHALALQRTFIERILPFDFLLYDERIVKIHRRVATEVAANFFLHSRQLPHFICFASIARSHRSARAVQDHLAQLHGLCGQHPCFSSFAITASIAA
jgi:hypothetical protein